MNGLVLQQVSKLAPGHNRDRNQCTHANQQKDCIADRIEAPAATVIGTWFVYAAMHYQKPMRFFLVFRDGTSIRGTRIGGMELG